ncbi:hypothetical protein [Mycolicibacter sinensis]|uniref:Mce protein n=1 Tax=Mycolicibacter sinensis (strain JDM601) TaxID=875328 RepID=A0A1A2E7S1_MYCSD|nr:hypothetical protein [Mycolicibacter sinensis]OBF96043.1 hypothetical protein A5772_17470 [Mycolicibacter sinensis]OBG00544.1 hypothetical protein A5771_18455 [Mycolicibacter sinensis]
MPDEEQPDISNETDDGVGDPGSTTAEAAGAEGEADERPVVKKPAPGKRAPAAKEAKGAMFSSYGLVSAFLGLVAVAALVFGLITWNMHRGDVDERSYRSRVLQTAASWTSVLINLNAENVEKGMARLRDKTVGELNSEFDAALAPYRDVVQKIQSRSSGRIEAVAIETERHNLDDPAATTEQASTPGRTDPVMVIATSIAENVGGRPQTVHWALHLDVSDVDGHLMISRLRSIR